MREDEVHLTITFHDMTYSHEICLTFLVPNITIITLVNVSTGVGFTWWRCAASFLKKVQERDGAGTR